MKSSLSMARGKKTRIGGMSGWVAESGRPPDPWPRALAQAPLFHRSLVAFQRVTGLTVKVVPATTPGKPIGLGVRENTFCRRVAAQVRGGCPMCHRTQSKLLRQADAKLKPHQICCLAGIIQLAVPVVVSGKHVATLLGGKVRLHPPSIAQFQRLVPRLRQWGVAGSLGPLRRVYLATPCPAAERLRDAVRLLDLLAQLFAKAVVHEPPLDPPAEAPLAAQVGAFVRQHLGEHLTTRRMASTLHLSEAYFCRRFHRLTGLTFHAYLARARVEAAKAALQEPETRINEIALAAGFQSASDFSRIFKAVEGVTPSAFRRQLPPARQPHHLENRWE
jgi:AraC-like DNA-binding protein